MDAPKIGKDLFVNNSRLAYALLGYCDGKLGRAPNPPKKHAAVYMSEFTAGRNAVKAKAAP